jgi:hypothetical protein
MAAMMDHHGMDMKVVVLKLPKHVPPPAGYVLVKELRKENIYNATIQVPKKIKKAAIEDDLSAMFAGFGLGPQDAVVKVADDFSELNDLMGKMSVTRQPSRGGSRKRTRKTHRKN